MFIFVFLSVVVIFALLGFFTVQFSFYAYNAVRDNLVNNRSVFFGKAMLYILTAILGIFFSVQNLSLAIISLIQRGLFNEFGVPQLSVIGYVLGVVVYFACKWYAENKNKQS